MTDKLKCCICGFEQEKTILSHVRQIHHMSAKEYRDKFNSPLRMFAGTIEQVKEMGYKNKGLLLGKPGRAKLPDNKWSREYNKCTQCGRVDSIHVSNGLCKKCFNNNRVKYTTKMNNAKIASQGKENKDYVICQICGLPFQSLTSNGHLKIHKISDQEYKKQFPLAILYCQNTTNSKSASVSRGRKNLMKTRGYLNPPSQRLSKSKEMAKRHSNKEFAKVSKIEYMVSDYFTSIGYSVFWNDHIGDASDNIIIRQYLFENCYCVDLACPHRKIIIEVLGDFWHGWEAINGNQKKEDQHPSVQSNMNSDVPRFNYIEHRGWTLIKIWEHDIKNGKYKGIINQYFPVIGDPHARTS